MATASFSSSPEPDGNPILRLVSPVDFIHKVVQLVVEVTVFFDVSPAGRSKLDKAHLSQEFRMLFKHEIKSLDSLRDPLGVVDTVNAKVNLGFQDPLAQFPDKAVTRFLDPGGLSILSYLIKINADGEGPDVGGSPPPPGKF